MDLRIRHLDSGHQQEDRLEVRLEDRPDMALHHHRRLRA